jgi:hypothetical protein
MQPFDSKVIVDLFLELYSVLVNKCYISAATLLLPPHTIPESWVQRYGADMDPAALDLIQRLLYIRGLYSHMTAPGAKSKSH